MLKVFQRHSEKVLFLHFKTKNAVKSNFVTNIQQYFRNLILNATGAERTLFELVADGDVQHALNLMNSNETDVDNALKEYYPQKHDIMYRRNKYPKNKEPYITCKLPRARQRYINEVELFFLLGNDIIWKKTDGSDEAFKLFSDFLADTRFNSKMRAVKRLAGSETECAKLYRLYKDENNKPQCDVVVLARSLGYELRILKDQYGNLIAFAYGYKLRDAEGKAVQHWDFLTKDMTYETTKQAVGWSVDQYPNPTSKINLIYFQQPKAWDGVEPRLKREEELDSKIGDTNNYFADPIAKATADVISSMFSPEMPAKMLQLAGPNSQFEYVNPPQSSELRKAEKDDLKDSILFDTFTPDFSFDKLRGMGTLTGKAIKNAMILGYLKRANRMEIYGELIDREKNVIIAVLKFLHPEMEKKLDELRITFEFAEPFDEDEKENWRSIADLYGAGLISLDEAVKRLALTDDPATELDLIRMGQIEQTLAQQEAKTEKVQESQPDNAEEETEEQPEQ